MGLRVDQARCPGCQGKRHSHCKAAICPPSWRRVLASVEFTAELGRCSSLSLCHPLSQIRLNSRGLIYSVGLLLASVRLATGLRLSLLSSPHLSPPSPWVLWLQSLFGHQDGLGLPVDRETVSLKVVPLSCGCILHKWILATHEKAPFLERCQPPLRSTACLKSNTNIYPKQ